MTVDTYLEHHGIKGQKWGVRRFQNEDGSYTSAGEKHREITTADLGRVGKMANNGSNAARSASDIARNIESKKRERSSNVDLSSMSDKELRDKINRMNMERQYKDLTAQEASRGKVYASDILQNAGGALAIASSAVAIAVGIQQLRGK